MSIEWPKLIKYVGLSEPYIGKWPINNWVVSTFCLELCPTLFLSNPLFYNLFFGRLSIFITQSHNQTSQYCYIKVHNIGNTYIHIVYMYTLYSHCPKIYIKQGKCLKIDKILEFLTMKSLCWYQNIPLFLNIATRYEFRGQTVRNNERNVIREKWKV